MKWLEGTTFKVPALVLLVAGGLLYGLAFWAGVVRDQDAATTDHSHEVLHAGNAYRHQLDVLTRAQLRDAKRFRSLTDSIGVLWAALIDTLPDSTGGTHAVGLGSVPDSGTAWKRLALVEHQGLAACAQTLGDCQQRATLAEARAAALDSALTAQVKVGSCHILFVRCPSREVLVLTSLVGGFLLGTKAH